MKQLIYIIVILHVALLSGCGIYTSYSRPDDIQTEGLYGETERTDTTSMASVPWRDFFTDPRLRRLIEEALENNSDMLTAGLRIEEAEATLRSSVLAFLPSLSLSPEVTATKAGNSSTASSVTVPATATWQIDIFGKLRNSKKKAHTQLSQSQSYKQAVQTSLIATIAYDYYMLVMLDEQLKISEETAANWKKIVDVTRALKNAGTYTEAAVASAEANLYNVGNTVIEYRQQIKETENTISSLLGNTPGTIERGGFDGWISPSSLEIGVPVGLLSCRPDVKEAEQYLAQTFYATNEARSAFYPSITLSGSAGWTSNGTQLFNIDNLILSAIGSLTQPVFKNGLLKANLKIAEAQQEEAKIAFKQTLVDAGIEVNNRLSQAQTAQQKRENLTLQISALEKAVASTDAMMKYGTTNYLEVLTAEQSLLSAKLTNISNQFNEIGSVINLYQALGGGIE